MFLDSWVPFWVPKSFPAIKIKGLSCSSLLVLTKHGLTSPDQFQVVVAPWHEGLLLQLLQYNLFQTSIGIQVNSVATTATNSW
jgi:hypothetical protein